jgi:3-oxoadipate enol-lactonase
MPSGNVGKGQAQDGCQLFYRMHSKPGKPRLVLIHSLALDHAIWNGVADELAADCEILLYDCRGHGQSDHRPGPYTVAQFANDLAALLDQVAWPSATIAGCSMGGCVAQAFAAAYPQRARALGLIDTTAWYGPTAPADWEGRAAKAAKDGFAAMLPFQVTRWFSDGFVATSAQAVNAATRSFVSNDLDCYQASCTMLGNMDLRNSVSELRMPVSVIVGEEDYATPLAMAQTLHSLIAGSTLNVIRGGRHITPVQCPGEIAALLMDLVRQTV